MQKGSLFFFILFTLASPARAANHACLPHVAFPPPLTSAPQILFVDNHPVAATYLIHALRWAGLEVDYFSDVSEAYGRVKKDPGAYRVFLSEVAMSPGTRYGLAESGEGLRTGELFYRDIRALGATGTMIFYTVSDLRGRERSIAGDDPNVRFNYRLESTLRETVEQVRQSLGLSSAHP